VAELEQDFKAAIDDYFETCRKIGKEPEKPFKGAFNRGGHQGFFSQGKKGDSSRFLNE